LPELVLGATRLRNVEFGKKLRFVESFDEWETRSTRTFHPGQGET
jgi:hypothetical protein